jgi:hypothetical protein
MYLKMLSDGHSLGIIIQKNSTDHMQNTMSQSPFAGSSIAMASVLTSCWLAMATIMSHFSMPTQMT